MKLLQRMLDFINKQSGVAKKILVAIFLIIPIAIGAIVAFVMMILQDNDNGGGGQDIHIIENPDGTKIPQNTQGLDQKIDEINKDIS